MELGKVLATKILAELESPTEPAMSHDTSTTSLIRRYRASNSNWAICRGVPPLPPSAKIAKIKRMQGFVCKIVIQDELQVKHKKTNGL